MQPFKRTIEKVLAWIANVLLILGTVLLSIVAFSGSLSTVLNSDTFKNNIQTEITRESNGTASLPSNYDDLIKLMETGIKAYAIIFIVVTIIALVATFTMKNRILSGVLFLISAAAVALCTLGTVVPVYLLHFIVAIMLFVRKEEPSYVNQNPYVNNGDSTSYKPSQKNNDDIDKIEYL